MTFRQVGVIVQSHFQQLFRPVLILTNFDQFWPARDAITFKNQNCMNTFRIDTSKSPHELVRLQTEFVATLNSIVLERLSKVLEVNISCQFISL